MPACSRALELQALSLLFLSDLHMAEMLPSSRNRVPSYPRLHSRQKNAKSYLGTVPKSLPSSSETVPLQQESTGQRGGMAKGWWLQRQFPEHTATGLSCMELNSVYHFWGSCTHCRASHFPATAPRMTRRGIGEEARQQQRTPGQLLHTPSPAIP